MRRVRYQDCSLQLVKGKKHHVWTYRYYGPDQDGNRHYKRTRIGTTEDYPTKAAALKAAEAIRLAVRFESAV